MEQGAGGCCYGGFALFRWRSIRVTDGDVGSPGADGDIRAPAKALRSGKGIAPSWGTSTKM